MSKELQHNYEKFCMKMSELFPFIQYNTEIGLYLKIGNFVDYEIHYEFDSQIGYGMGNYDIVIYNGDYNNVITLEINLFNTDQKNRATIICNNDTDLPDESLFILMDCGFEIVDKSTNCRDILRKYTLKNIIND